jgi:zinc protease
LTGEDIRRVAGTYLTTNNLTTVSLNPKGALTAKSAAAKPIVADEIQKIELSNGLRILVREDARLPLVSITAVFRGGLLAETRETNGITYLMAKALLKGTTTRTAEQIADTIESVGGNIGSDAGNNSFSVSLDVTQPDLRLAGELLADVLLNATHCPRRASREKEVQLAAIRMRRTPHAVARNICAKRLFASILRVARQRFAERSKLTREDPVRFAIATRGRGNGVISVFRQREGDELKQLFEPNALDDETGALAPANARRASRSEDARRSRASRLTAQGVLMVGYRGADMFNKDRYALELIDEASSDLGSRFLRAHP